MWKNIAEEGRSQMTIWHMSIACWILKATNTHRIFYNYCFSTAKMVDRTRLIVTLHVHCMSCLL